MDEQLPTVPTGARDLPGSLELGAFSVSLAVADLATSTAFYAKLGFVVTGGDDEAGYAILKNGETTIGLFCGMFEKNILTFNPGLTNRMERIESFTDVRQVQAELDHADIGLDERVAPDTSGAGHITLVDPDGNPILIDQFF